MTELINVIRKAHGRGLPGLRLLLMFGLFLISLPGLAQNITVTGTVTDSQTGETMIGLNVVIKGTVRGVVTDVDGKYTMTNCPPDATLVFSYVGYEALEIPVQGKTVVDAAITPSSSFLDEVVVIGYGTAKKSDLTGSVATISGEKLQKIPMTNAADVMKGRLSGVNVFTTDGSPDAEIVIRVRGGNSITQDNSPLYVVDGFIVSSIRDIPPTDISSMTVLKDAAATAIYGAQAANGVIIITTKSPVAGKLSVSYNGYVQMKNLPVERKMDVLSPYEYVMAQYEYYAMRNSATELANFTKYFGNYADLELYKYKKPTDWQDELFGNSQLSQQHNVSISGGTDKTKLSLSFTNNNDEGLLVGSGYRRNVVNFKLNQEIVKSLSFDASARITNTVVDGAGTSGAAQLRVKDAIVTRPVNGVADELDIDLTSVDQDDYQSFLLSMINPLQLAADDWRKRLTNNYVLNAGLAWDILENLTVKTVFTYEQGYDDAYRFYGPLTSESRQEGSSLPLGTISSNQSFSYRWLNTINYNLTNIGLHKLDFMLGQEIYSSGGKGSFVRNENFRESITPEELFANMNFGVNVEYRTWENTESNRLSFFGRANYSYNDKYLVTATLRGDASSKFSKENRIGFFPAFALGWKMNEEDFIANTGIFEELKFRASYGTTGNDRISSNATKFLFGPYTSDGPGMGTNAYNVYYGPLSSDVLYNPNLVWETTTNRNIGLDFAVLKGRLSGSVDLYYNTTKNLLLTTPISPTSGFKYQWDNIGSTSGKGIEFVLNGVIVDTKDLMISANLNVGISSTKVESLGDVTNQFYQSNWSSTDLKDRDDYYLEVGKEIGLIYGYVTDGMYQTSDFSGYNGATKTYTLNTGVPDDKAILGVSSLRPGYLKLQDRDSSGVVNSLDRKIIGHTMPKSTGGFGFEVSFKGFDASAFFNYSYGNQIYNTGKIDFNQLYRTTYGNMLSSQSMDKRFAYIDVDGTITGTAGTVVTDLEQLRQMNADKTTWNGACSFGTATTVVHTWAIEDGSFLRLNVATIGYTIPQSISSRFGVSRLRLYVTGNNLWIWTKYSGYDPEVTTTRSNNYNSVTPGIDFSSYPRSRGYLFGVNVTF